jgi:iron complex transport system ATP-binding protein
MNPNMNIIELDHITLNRGDRRILTDVSWSIAPGQHWAMLGANGSGKTTLLKVITGYEWPSVGSVRVLGETFGQTELQKLRRRIGWVTSSLAGRYGPRVTAREIVLTGLDAALAVYRDFTEQEYTAAKDALTLMGVDHLADQRYELCSQGEQQRILLARGLVHRPALLILDEPCAGLDPAARATFLSDLHRLTRQPDAPTILLVTHHIEEIAPWIEHVFVLRTGQVLAQGPKPHALTSEMLTQAFGHTMRVDRDGERYTLHPKD